RNRPADAGRKTYASQVSQRELRTFGARQPIERLRAVSGALGRLAARAAPRPGPGRIGSLVGAMPARRAWPVVFPAVAALSGLAHSGPTGTVRMATQGIRPHNG